VGQLAALPLEIKALAVALASLVVQELLPLATVKESP